MPLRTRLNLRQNWPLWMVIVAFALILVWLVQVLQSGSQQVFVLSQNTVIDYWRLVNSHQKFGAPMPDFKWPLVTLITMGCVLIFIIGLKKRKWTTPVVLSVGAVVIVVGIGVGAVILRILIPPTITVLTHTEGLTLDGQRYNLAFAQSYDPARHTFYANYLVYRCDPQDTNCTLLYLSENFFPYDSLHIPSADLKRGSYVNELYVEFKGQETRLTS